jgi:hypothetical protein
VSRMMPFGGPTPMHPVDPGPGEIRECREVGVADQPGIMEQTHQALGLSSRHGNPRWVEFVAVEGRGAGGGPGLRGRPGGGGRKRRASVPVRSCGRRDARTAARSRGPGSLRHRG